MKSKILLVALCLAPVILFARVENFTRTLVLGMRGGDVRELQRILNADPETYIALSGDGSPGNETDYFGSATKRALIKFQEKYRAEILTPAGLTSGTGVFGAKTRAKAVSLWNAVSIPKSTAATPIAVNTTTQKKVDTNAASESKGGVVVMFPSQYSGKPGTMVTLSGAGFTATDNAIYFGDAHTVARVASRNGQAIMFGIPEIPKGLYPLFVKNANGESKKSSFFIVTDGVTPGPKIESITPRIVQAGGEAVIKGSGFILTGNTLMVDGVGLFKDIPSAGGESIHFTVPKNALTATISTTTNKSLPIWVHVLNENGVSNAESFFVGS